MSREQCEYRMAWAAERKIDPQCTRPARGEADGKKLCALHLKRGAQPAGSPYLNLPLRTEEQACADIERKRRLEEHGAKFCRQILDGAFTREYRPDGSYKLTPVNPKVA